MDKDESVGLKAWGTAILRAVVGAVFLVHGAQKFFVMGFAGTAAFMAQVGIPAPALASVVVIAVEFLGGLALVVGLFTRWAATFLAINMVVGILVVHLRAGFFLPDGYEFALTLLAANVALTLSGSGAASVDGVLATRKG